MSTFDERLPKAVEGIYVDSTGRRQIKDSHINNGMTLRVKKVLDELLKHGNIIITDTTPHQTAVG